jgi:hypothetical protein
MSGFDFKTSRLPDLNTFALSSPITIRLHGEGFKVRIKQVF